jgi:hypothetical protein
VTDDPFIVRYRGKYTGFYLARILPLTFLFAILAALYLDDDMRRWIFSHMTSKPKAFSWVELGFLLMLVAAPLIDLALTLRRARPGAVALTLSDDGITGAIFHVNRLLAWHKIADVVVDGRFLVVRRRPGPIMGSFLADRGLGEISLPARHLDRSIDEILAASRHFAPPGALRPIRS